MYLELVYIYSSDTSWFPPESEISGGKKHPLYFITSYTSISAWILQELSFNENKFREKNIQGVSKTVIRINWVNTKQTYARKLEAILLYSVLL
jgi:hypothetical protein